MTTETMPTEAQVEHAIRDALATEGLSEPVYEWLRNQAASHLRPVPRPPVVRPAETLVGLFEEATALARDETLDDAQRGRLLVELLGETDTRRITLTHHYGPKMADDMIATRNELGEWRLKRSDWPALEFGDETVAPRTVIQRTYAPQPAWNLKPDGTPYRTYFRHEGQREAKNESARKSRAAKKAAQGH